MPELPEVETVRSGLLPMVGRQMMSCRCHRADLRYPLPDFAPLLGRTVTAVRRRAKYLLFDMNGGVTLVWHLGMTGQFHLLDADAPAGSHEHVRIDLDNGTSLRYRDARRFGYAGIVDTARLDQHPWFAKLGPEPLSDAFDSAHLAACCQSRATSIKNRIMDAGVVVGVGNIYASESLFRAGIHPTRPAGRISSARLARLVAAIRSVLQEAIAAGGSTISDFVNSDGKPGYFAHSFQVYGRSGKACLRCGTPIKKITQSGRSTFYCPNCQR